MSDKRAKTGIEVFRDLATSEQMRALLLSFINDVTNRMASIESSLEIGATRAAFGHAHNLKNAFLEGGFLESAEACNPVLTMLDAGLDATAQLPKLRALCREVIAAVRLEPELLSEPEILLPPGP